MGKALKTVGVIIGGAALIATGVGALAMPALAGTTTLFGVSVGTLNTISSGLIAVGGMLDKPKSQGSASPDEWTSNPDQPTPFLMGRMGVAGKIVQRDEFGPDNMYQGIVGIISGAGPIRGVTAFAGDKQPVTFGANGIAISSQWQGEMWMVRRAGAQPDTALSVPAGLKSGGDAFEWSSAAKLSGKACYLQVLGENSKGTAFPAGIPDPVHEAEGIFGYDPRYDDTYPGGAGPCRLGVRSTYRWIEDGGTGALNWALGLVENGQVVGGIGASIDGIDVPAFVEVANIADANGWKLAAWPDSSEDASAVLDQLLQAAGAVRARHAGKISCVSRGAPRASVATITARDTAGDIELDTAPSLFNRLNTITPRFMSSAAGWLLTPANPVSFAQYVTDDGGKHGDQIDYRFVPLLKQAAELAAYDILDAREPFSGTIPLKAHMRHLKRGDTFLVSEPGFLMDGVKCIVLSRSYNPKTAQVRIGFRSETDSKHALALGKTTTLPAFPVLTPTDTTYVSPPAPTDWTVIVRPPSEGGGQVPGFDLTGAVGNAAAYRVLVEYGPTDTSAGPWTVAYDGPPTTEHLSITVPANEVYYVAISYLNQAGNVSQRTIYGPYTAPGLTADDVIIPGGRRISEQFPATVDLLVLTENARRASQTLIRETLERWNRTKDEKIASIEREEIIKDDLVETRETLTAANNGALALIESVETASVNRDAAETATRQTQISVINDNVAALELTTGTLATNLSAETYQRMIAVSAVADSVSSAQFSISTLATALSAETSTRATQYAATLDALAVYDTRITTATTQSSTNAEAITTLGASLAGVSGTITTLQSANVALNGKVNLLYGFALNAGGRVAGMYAANDGSISVIDFEFDVFRIWSGSASVPMFAVDSGNVYIAGNRVNTASLTANAVTNGASARTTGVVIASGETTVQTCATTTAGGRVRVDFSVLLNGGSATPSDVTATVYRNGSALWSGVVGRLNGVQRLYLVINGGSSAAESYVDIPGELNAAANGFFIDTDPSGLPGSYTYILTIACPTGILVSERNMALLEIKR